MTIEEIRYDFTEHMEQFHRFFERTMKLLIISKLNCQESNKTSVSYFNELVSRINGCEFHKIKYGKPMLFTKFLGLEFNYHTVRVTMKITDKFIIDMTIESMITDFVDFFDKMTMEHNKIAWNKSRTNYDTVFNYGNTQLLKNGENNIELKSPEIKIQKEEEEHKEHSKMHRDTVIQTHVSIILSLLDLFIDSLIFLISLSHNNPNSLNGKYIELKDISVTKRLLNLEIIIDGNTVILELDPKTKDKVSVTIDDDHLTGRTLREIMFQNSHRQNG